MSTVLSRRLLIGGAMTGAAAVAALASGQVARAAPAPAPASDLPADLFGPKSGVAALSRNENPYGPAPGVAAAVMEAAGKSAYYANPDYLIAMIAEKNAIRPEQIAVSCGSGDALAAAALALGKRGTLVVPELFWESTVRYAEAKGVKVKRIPLTKDWDIDLDAMEAAVDGETAMVQVCNPNNPTGKLLDPAKLKAFVTRVSKKTTVLIDEAYNELTLNPEKNSVMDNVRAGENVIVARTFSKIYGMAGMRIGYMMTTPDNAKMVNDYLMSSLGAPQIAAGVASYNDEKFLAFSKSKVTEAREMVYAAVKASGLSALPSETNFVYVKVPDATALQKHMASKQIMIRGPYGKLTEWSRVSMGRIEDVERYTKALKEFYA
jgi:histidinol-phosphate aminotransferase